MSDSDDERDVPFADHSADQRRESDAADEQNDGAAEDRDSDEERDREGEYRAGGTGEPFGEFGQLAGEALKVFGAVRDRLVTPVLQNYPEVREHLGAAGAEVLSAYRAMVHSQERDWREEPQDTERITVEQIDDDDDDGADDDSAHS